MAATPSTPRPHTPPVFCHQCDFGYGDFTAAYSGKPEELLRLAMDHHLVASAKECGKCGKPCRIDFNRKDFRCDKTSRNSSKQKRRCNFSISMLKDTWFGKANLDIETNLRFVNFFLRDFFSYKAAKEELALSDNTICDWASFCREVLVSWCLDRDKKIGGPDKIVEIDESKFGKRKYNVGRVIDGQWVFGGICRQTRDFFLVPVADRTAATLLTIIKDRIEPGTTIISDCWKAYDCLAKEDFIHLKVNHTYNFVDPETLAHTNTIERKWRDAKRKVPAFGRRKSHFVGYLSVCMFKMHIQDSNKRFHAFVQAAAKLYPPP